MSPWAGGVEVRGWRQAKRVQYNNIRAGAAQSTQKALIIF